MCKIHHAYEYAYFAHTFVQKNVLPSSVHSLSTLLYKNRHAYKRK